jgi:gliding motility-associated-like protein
MKQLLLSSILLFFGLAISAQTNFIHQDSVFTQSSDCTGGVSVCIDSIKYDDIADYRFFLDGAPFSTTFEACREDTVHTYSYFVIYQDGETGPFALNSWVVNGQTFSIANFSTLNQLLDSMRRWDPAGNWQIEPAAQIIYGFPTSGKTYSCQSITGLGRGGRNDVCYNIGFNFTGLKFKVNPGIHKFVVEKISTGDRDTVTLGAACVQSNSITQTQFVGTTRSHCMDLTQLLGTPVLATFKNFCSKTYTHVNYNPLFNFCVDLIGLSAGTDTACMRVCDQYGICDTTYLYTTAEINTGRFYIFQDTITIGSSRQKCDIKIPTGTINVFTNDCPSRSGNSINFALDAGTRCVTYSGIAVGPDTACIRVCNTGGECDTTHFIITGQNAVLPIGGSKVIFDTVIVGQLKTNCNITKPNGALASFANFCPLASGTNVRFQVDSSLGCINYRGLVVGTNNACIKVCNINGICDTTNYFVTVRNIEQGGSFTYRDTVLLGATRQKCDVTLPSGTITIFENICSARSGTNVNFNLDLGTRCVTYTGLTLGIDTACVRVCNSTGACDTTSIIIETKPVTIPQTGGRYTFTDTVTVGTAQQKCDIKIPTGTINIFENLCLNNSGTNVSFILDAGTNCVRYSGVLVGIDTACVRVCNTSGVCDTTYMYIEAKPAINNGGFRNHTFTDTITVGSTRQKCNITIPSGTINVFQNLCPTNSGTNVGFGIDIATRCITYTGISVGIDSACIRVCNTGNVCDTTYMYIGTLPASAPTRNHIFNDTITVGLNRKKCDFITPNNPTLIRNLCPTTSGTNIRFALDTVNKCVTYTGVTVGVDTACILICDATGKCDTTTMYVTGKTATSRPIIKPSIDTVRLKIFERKPYCPDSLELAGSPISLLKFCTPATFNNSTISLDTVKKCVGVTGLSAGVDTFCLALCNTAGFCDTTTLYVIVSPDTLKPTPAIDSFSIKIGELKVYCPDSTELASALLNDIHSCTPLTVDNTTIKFNTVTKCVEARGTKAGKDTVCTVLCNALGLCDTTILYITVTADTVKPIADTVRLTIKLGQNIIFDKIDSTQIFGSVDTVYDRCPGKNGSFARMILNKQEKKVSITGVNVGRDTMCVVVCNKASKLCDTTVIVVIVIDTTRLTGIQAFDDFDTLRQGKSIVFEVYKNDTLKRQIPKFLTIIRPPLKGKADTISFRDGLIKYTAGKGPNACGLDSFRYRVCIDSTTCSEATVIIDVRCPEGLKTYTGFSPNGDGRNDYFVIEGLQKYPDNTINIFNRWGNEIYKAKNYQNDWDGKWNGKDVPDGVYFYWIRDDATGEVLLTGYVQILR